MGQKKVIIIGAGPGGLASAMRLTALGYKVEIYEKRSQVGGRTGSLELGEYRFDIGPSTITMPHLLTGLFIDCNRNILDYLSLVPIDPLYKLYFTDKTFAPSPDQRKTLREIKQAFPGNEKNYLHYMRKNAKKMLYISPLIEIPFFSYFDFFRPTVIRALPSLAPGKNLIDDNISYFANKQLQLAFSFQLNYLGVAPKNIPSFYSIMAFCDYHYGTYHPIGGQNQIIFAMERVVRENNGKIHLNSAIKHLEIKNKKIIAATLESGERVTADYFFINSDFSYTINSLLDIKDQLLVEDITKQHYLTSAIVIYLGLNKQYPLEHQSVIFHPNFKKDIAKILKQKIPLEDFAIYVMNPSALDTSMAPVGHSSIRIMVPVPNNKSQIEWHKVKKELRQVILEIVKERLDLPDLEEHIQVEKIITPFEWERDFNIYLGAVFGVHRTLFQLGSNKPTTKMMKKLKNTFIVGTGAHPGGTLPMNIASVSLAVTSLEKKEKKLKNKRKHREN